MKTERTVVTKVQNAVLFSDGTIRVDNVRLSYPHVDKPYESEGDDGQKKAAYSVVGMLPKSTHTAAKDLIKKVILELQTKNDAKVKSEHWFLKNGDDEDKEEYKSMFIIKASEARRPSVRKRDGSVMSEREMADEIYGGMWGNILLRPWYFSGKAKNGKTYPKRVLANFLALQKTKDDESFGEGRINDEGVFDAVEDDGSDGLGDDDNSGL